MKLKTLILFVVFCSCCNAQNISDHIHIDQFGYLPNAQKVAVLSNPIVGYNSAETYSPGSTLSVINGEDGSVIFTGSITQWGSGATHDQSGDQGWWFDFSSVNTPGIYYILDTENNVKSYDFKIEEGVYLEVLKSAMKMFYYNRCNMAKEAPFAEDNWVDANNFSNALQDTECRFIFDRYNDDLEKDLSGGWFDAGDYNKYVTFTNTTLHNLLYAYEENTEIFTDDWNIPESGNGISDILDEINWEIAWLEKMTNVDGSVINKVGSQNYGENISSPPSVNIDQRFYGNTCSSASIAVSSIFAHASMVYAEIPELSVYAETLKQKAILCFDYVTPQLNSGLLDLDCDDGSIVSGDSDVSWLQQYEDALIAAFYLYEITDSMVYEDYIIANINDAAPVRDDWVGPETTRVLEVMFQYAQRPDADAPTVAAIMESVLPHIEGDWNDYFGMNDLDLYRGQIPDWAYFWGSNRVKSEFGNLNSILAKYSIDPDENDNHLEKASELVHYFHGVNPQNRVYLTNMYSRGGDHCVNEIYHTWFNDGTDYDHALNSLYGPAPGFLTGGPNRNYEYVGYSPPHSQPEQKSYKDFNDNNGESVPWQVTEPAIYYQAAYVRLLANYVNNPCLGRSIIYVDRSANGVHSGQTWTDAYKHLTTALQDECIDYVDSMLLAEGAYIPQTNDREFSYDTPKEITIRGGYSAGGGTHNSGLYESIISGDIGILNEPNDNLYHCFSTQSDPINLVLKDLTLKDGYADGSNENGLGAGLLQQGNITLENIRFETNTFSSTNSVIETVSGVLKIKGQVTLLDNSQL